MPIKETIQIPSKDGCVYIFSSLEKRWLKICPVIELPADVKAAVDELKSKADLLKDAV